MALSRGMPNRGYNPMEHDAGTARKLLLEP